MNSFRVAGLIVFVFSFVNAWASSDFASEVVDFQGDFLSTGLYDDPNATLGKPSVRCLNNPIFISDPNQYRVKLVEAPQYLSLQQEPVITSINPNEWLVVKFDHKVVDYPDNPYGQDLIVFGNSTFGYNSLDYVSDTTNINTLMLTATGIFDEVLVSVSQDGQNWHSFDSVAGPWGDDLYPTQAYRWDRESVQWTDEEMDFTKPVNPSLTLADFVDISVAGAIELYDDSGGGAPFDLKNLPSYDDLTVDPDSGYRWIQYVRLEGGEGQLAIGGEVDAVSDVAVCGDPTHPYPQGDVNLDCRVDFQDFSVLSSQWLMIDCGTCGGADLSDPLDQSVAIDDLIVIVENWLNCTYNCR